MPGHTQGKAVDYSKGEHRPAALNNDMLPIQGHRKHMHRKTDKDGQTGTYRDRPRGTEKRQVFTIVMDLQTQMQNNTHKDPHIYV